MSKIYDNGIYREMTAEEIEQRQAEQKKHMQSLNYDELVERFVRQRYSQSDVEAIINNYLGDNGNEQYQSEFNALQEYRKECKAKAKEMLGR